MNIEKVKEQHLRVYSIKTLSEEIRQAGFDIEIIQYVSVFEEFRSFDWLSDVVVRSDAYNKFMASGIYMIARKKDVE